MNFYEVYKNEIHTSGVFVNLTTRILGIHLSASNLLLSNHIALL